MLEKKKRQCLINLMISYKSATGANKILSTKQLCKSTQPTNQYYDEL